MAAAFGVAFAVAGSAAGQTIRVRPAAPPSRIGIASRDVSAADVSRDKLPGEFGAYVNHVSPGGPAEKAGIRAGDVIVEFDGERVRSNAELQRLVRETPAGRAVKVGLVREGKRMDVALTTEANPDSRDFGFEIPMLEFREGPLQPPRAESPFGFPGSIPLPGTPRLGIGLQELTPQLAQYFRTKEGVLVSSVDDDSPASRAGLKAGDIITSIDARPVARAGDVTRAVREKQPGDQVTLGIVRDGKPRTVTVTL